ncbi:MAG: type II toxin-antitoxin system ParD family antitoxin [Candidatus Hinthialibacter antarcticus]|nr:type II toxin-antitoxin system ParD family antitoxin [Candidatus Hinthialibacter antarcticus]
MTMTNKTISLTDQQSSWMESLITQGNYENESEIVRDLIRKEQMRVSEIEMIRAALIEGENSGISSKTPEEIFASAKARLTKDGKI